MPWAERGWGKGEGLVSEVSGHSHTYLRPSASVLTFSSSASHVYSLRVCVEHERLPLHACNVRQIVAHYLLFLQASYLILQLFYLILSADHDRRKKGSKGWERKGKEESKKCRNEGEGGRKREGGRGEKKGGKEGWRGRMGDRGREQGGQERGILINNFSRMC